METMEYHFKRPLGVLETLRFSDINILYIYINYQNQKLQKSKLLYPYSFRISSDLSVFTFLIFNMKLLKIVV